MGGEIRQEAKMAGIKDGDWVIHEGKPLIYHSGQMFSPEALIEYYDKVISEWVEEYQELTERRPR